MRRQSKSLRWPIYYRVARSAWLALAATYATGGGGRGKYALYHFLLALYLFQPTLTYRTHISLPTMSEIKQYVTRQDGLDNLRLNIATMQEVIEEYVLVKINAPTAKSAACLLAL